MGYHKGVDRERGRLVAGQQSKRSLRRTLGQARAFHRNLSRKGTTNLSLKQAQHGKPEGLPPGFGPRQDMAMKVDGNISQFLASG